MLKIKDVAPGKTFYTQERLGDDIGGMEVRETYYVRDPDAPCRYPHNVRAGRLATIQGDPTASHPPRYCVSLETPCRDPGEIDGRVLVHLVGDDPAGIWEQAI